MKKFILIVLFVSLSVLSGFLVNKLLNGKTIITDKNNISDNTDSNSNDNNDNISNNNDISENNNNSSNQNNNQPNNNHLISNKEKASKILANMSLDEKVGQMFFVRCRKNTALEDLQLYKVGGFILFDDNVKNETKDSLSTTLKSYQDNSKIKLLIGIDEEGGIVNRLSRYTTFRGVPFYSPQDLYNEGGNPLIISDTKEKATLLKSLGINVNLAPVCDVSTNSYDYIYPRAFGKNAIETSKYIKTVVTTMKENNIGSTLKHFPGYGNNLDTHTGISIDERSYEIFKTSDFLPFEAGIKAGADSILVSHNIVKSMDENLPASLSPNVHNIIRNELNYDKVIMTDDLQMDAIKEYIGDYNSAVLAINAGNDLLIASDFDVQIPVVLQAIQNGEISEERINESVLRVLLWKIDLGLL